MTALRGARPGPGVLTPAARAALMRPEVLIACLMALGGWLGLLALSTGPERLAFPIPATAGAGSQGLAPGGVPAHAAPARLLLEWAVMVAAMMGLTLLPTLRHAARSSFAAERGRALAATLSGWIGAWMLAGVAVLPVLALGRSALESLGLAAQGAALGSAVAALWWLSPAKARALARCHRKPVFPTEPMAQLRFGARHGARCIANCLPLMAPLALAPHGLAPMALLTLLLLAERQSQRPDPRGPALVLGLAALLLAVPI